MVRYAGPDTDLTPDASTIRQFFAWWFERCTRGVVEVGWLGQDRLLTNFQQFDIGQWDELTAFVYQENLVPGQSMYFRASTVRAGTNGRTSDNDFVSAPGPWNDIDTHEQMEAARQVQTIIRANGRIVTGTVPHVRAQSFFRCDAPIVSADLVRSLNTRIHKLYGGDPSVINPSRLMRLPGTIAWPWKPDRVPEVTTFAVLDGRNPAYPLALLTSQLPQDEQPAPPKPASTTSPIFSLTTSGGPITAAGTITLAGTLAVANGGTGTSTPSLVQGTNVTITGTWPNQTINSTGAAQVYPGAGIANSTGTAWDTSYTTTGTGTVVALATSAALTTPAITGGTINNATIGATTPTTAVFTSLTVNDNSTFGSSNTDTINFVGRVNSDFDPATDNAYDLGRTGHEWRNLYLTGTGNIDSLIADTADINGGTIDATTIGATTPSSGAFTTLTATTAIPVTSGGTGQSSALTQYGIVFASTTGAMATTAAGTAGYVLTSNGTSAPTFQAASGGLSRAQTTAISLVFGF